MGNLHEGVANAWLNALCRNAAYSLNTEVYVQLHTGDPGVAGTANAATETTRQQATFGDAADDGAISNTAAVEWTDVSDTETYSWVSLWSADTDGTFLGHDELSSPAAVTAGDTFRLPVGDLDITVSTVLLSA